ncbi:MAG: hypothetical protein JXA30_18240 [Deltaproteobacteria bacterium]|nr:hypothetical protein [Deltaproteobacteria bacterium]
MKAVVSCTFALMFTLSCSPEKSRNDDYPALPTACQPDTQRQCPCVGSQGVGTQICNQTGDGYGPCFGCPEQTESPSQFIDASAKDTGIFDNIMIDAASGNGLTPFINDSGDGNSPVDAARPLADTGTAQADTGTSQADTGALGPEFGDINIVAPGVSCGVGLPRLCELGAEKCCVRSLDTDTCIPLNDTCDCKYEDCYVMQAYCDGPEDCATNEVCCGTISTASYSDIRYTLIECTAQCNTTAGTQYEVCHIGETECGPGRICANSQLLTNIQVCIDPASIEQ